MNLNIVFKIFQMKNKTNLGGRSQSHQIDITEENLKRKCGGGYLDNVHWIFTQIVMFWQL